MGLLSRFRAALQRREPRASATPGAGGGQPDAQVAAIVARLRALVVEQSDGTRAPADVAADDHLYDRGHVDSMSAVSLLTFIEDEYDVSVEEAELVGRLCSLDALARHIALGRSASAS